MYYGINNLIKNLEDFKLKFRTNINKVTECGILLLNSKIVMTLNVLINYLSFIKMNHKNGAYLKDIF